MGTAANRERWKYKDGKLQLSRRAILFNVPYNTKGSLVLELSNAIVLCVQHSDLQEDLLQVDIPCDK